MRITHKLLELYREGVDLGLDIKLNLWTKDGEEFFSFSRVSRPDYRRRSRRRNRGVMSTLKEVRLPQQDMRSPLKEVGSPLKEVRSPLKEVRSPLTEVLPSLKDARQPLRDVSRSPGRKLGAPVRMLGHP